MNLLERFESAAQRFVRHAPIVFTKGRGGELFDDKGNRYIDFDAGGGTVSHGHNDLKVCQALIDYLCEDGVWQTADRASAAKRRFLEAFVTGILQPRDLEYKLLFTEPAAGMAAELAIRLARLHTKQATIVAFTQSHHGVTEGALSLCSALPFRAEPHRLRQNVVFAPFDGYFGADSDTLSFLGRFLSDPVSGLEKPAAVLVETVQVHGGVNVASLSWLKSLEGLCRELGILLIVDETETGCGRTGSYFSFEHAGLTPDMVLVSSAIAGGLPMSFLLLRPQLDLWRPGDQMGVFQGNAIAFVAATELASRWTEEFAADLKRRSRVLAQELAAMAARYPASGVRVRGTGMIFGLDFGKPGSAALLSAWALEHGVLAEPAAGKDSVLLIRPPLTMEETLLREGLERLARAIAMFRA